MQYNVLDYNIINDGITNNTKAILKLIDVIHSNGGGTLYFPAGKYVTGSIILKSNITLFLDNGSVILGSGNVEDYPLITNEVISGWNMDVRTGVVAARDAVNVGICGRGTINGRGQNWWHDTGDHRPRSIQFINCRNVSIKDITIINSPMWTVHPIRCENVLISGISIINPHNSPNTDGINPESCNNVRISDCYIDVGDDCITLKSGTQDCLYIKEEPCQNITITNCNMAHGHGGVVIGSEMSGGVKNVTITNCTFNGTDRGIRVKTRRLRGGVVENIIVNNIIMKDVISPVVINSFYHCGCKPEDLEIASDTNFRDVQLDTPKFKNFHFSNLIVENAKGAACYIEGLPEMYVDGLTIDNFAVSMLEDESLKPVAPAMTFKSKDEKNLMKGKGLIINNAKNVILKNVKISLKKEVAMELKNITNISVVDFNRTVETDADLIIMENVEGHNL